MEEAALFFPCHSPEALPLSTGTGRRNHWHFLLRKLSRCTKICSGHVEGLLPLGLAVDWAHGRALKEVKSLKPTWSARIAW